MKKTITFILALILTVALSICGFAEGIEKTGCRDFTSFFDADELSKVLSDTDNDTFMTQMPAADSGETKPYKRYDVQSGFIYLLANGKNLTDMISPEHMWIVPGRYSYATVVLTEDNKWHTTGYGEYTQEVIDAGIAENDSVNDKAVNLAIENIASKSPAEIKDVVCVYSADYFTDFVCVITTEETYLIPFASRPEFTGLTNGAVYSPKEAIKILLQTSDTIVDEYNENGFTVGGFGVRLYRVKNKMNLLILIMPAAVAAVTAIIIVVHSKAKRNNVRRFPD